MRYNHASLTNGWNIFFYCWHGSYWKRGAPFFCVIVGIVGVDDLGTVTGGVPFTGVGTVVGVGTCGMIVPVGAFGTVVDGVVPPGTIGSGGGVLVIAIFIIFVLLKPCRGLVF